MTLVGVFGVDRWVVNARSIGGVRGRQLSMHHMSPTRPPRCHVAFFVTKRPPHSPTTPQRSLSNTHMHERGWRSIDQPIDLVLLLRACVCRTQLRGVVCCVMPCVVVCRLLCCVGS